MNNLELTVTQKPGVIEINFEELKAQLSDKMSEYRGAVFTEDSKQIAKGELANLRKLQKTVDERRKDVKAECMRPYTEFEKKVNELKDIIDEPIQLIDKQLKEVEAERIKKRREDVEEIYKSIPPALAEILQFLPLDEIYQHKWDLAGTKLKNIQEDMEELVKKTQAETELIRSTQSDVAPEALDIYKRSRNLTDALEHINRYEANKKMALAREEERRKKEEEQRRQAEIERVKAEERQKLREIEQAKEQERKRVEAELAATRTAEVPPIVEEPFSQEDEIDVLPFSTPTTVTAFYKVIATPEELGEVEMAFNSIGIIFERREA